MALFVDLDEEAEPPQTQHYGLKPEWNGERAQQQLSSRINELTPTREDSDQSQPIVYGESENPNEHNGMTEALGCYP